MRRSGGATTDDEEGERRRRTTKRARDETERGGDDEVDFVRKDQHEEGLVRKDHHEEFHLGVDLRLRKSHRGPRARGPPETVRGALQSLEDCSAKQTIDKERTGEGRRQEDEERRKWRN